MSFALCSTLAYYLYIHYQLLNYFPLYPDTNSAQYSSVIIENCNIVTMYLDIKVYCSPQLASRGEPLFVRVSIFLKGPEPGFFGSGTRILGINYHWLDYHVIHIWIQSGFLLYIDIINNTALRNSLVSSKPLKIKVLPLKSLCVTALDSNKNVSIVEAGEATHGQPSYFWNATCEVVTFYSMH